MFHLSPISLKPAVRASRDQHVPFEGRLLELISKISEEKEVVDLDFAKSKTLLNSLDVFFCYGLYSADKCYWPFVREFLPKTESQLLKVEWQCTSDRALSVAWLKDALNRGSLHFQFLAFKESKTIIARFYHANACMRNPLMVNRVAEACEKLTKVQFSFNSPSVARQEFIPTAVVIDASPLPANRIRRRKPRRPDIEEREVVPANVHTRVLPTQLDQEYILNELVHQRRLRQNGYTERDGNEIQQQSLHAPSAAQETRGEERLDEVLRKNISINHIESLVDITEPRSFDSLLNLDDLKQKVEQELEPKADHCEGEIQLKSGEILQLAMDIFLDQREKLQNCFHVYDGFVVGRPLERLFLVTDHNIYILSQSQAFADNVDELHIENVHHSVDYHVHCIAPLEKIDYIGVSDDAQSVLLFAKEGESFIMNDEDAVSGRVVTVATGELQLGNTMSTAIVKAAEKGEREGGAPPVYTDNTPYALIVRRFLGKELKNTELKVMHTSFVFWRETTVSPSASEVSQSGYLFHRSVVPNWWRKSAQDWVQSYFILKGRKLYMFTDSSCKVGERVMDLSGGTVETQEVELKKDYSFVFEISFPLKPAENAIQLACPSRDEMGKWMHLISVSLSSQEDGDDVVSCALIVTESHIVVCQEGRKCLMDEFMRSLIVFNLDEIGNGIVIRQDGHYLALLLEVGDVLEWFFFRSDAELCRIIKALDKYIPFTELGDLSEERSRALTNQASRVASSSGPSGNGSGGSGGPPPFLHHGGPTVPLHWKPLIVTTETKHAIYRFIAHRRAQHRDKVAREREKQQRRKEEKLQRERAGQELESVQKQIADARRKLEMLSEEKHETFQKFKATLMKESELKKKVDEEKKSTPESTTDSVSAYEAEVYRRLGITDQMMSPNANSLAGLSQLVPGLAAGLSNPQTANATLQALQALQASNNLNQLNQLAALSALSSSANQMNTNQGNVTQMQNASNMVNHMAQSNQMVSQQQNQMLSQQQSQMLSQQQQNQMLSQQQQNQMLAQQQQNQMVSQQQSQMHTPTPVSNNATLHHPTPMTVAANTQQMNQMQNVSVNHQMNNQQALHQVMQNKRSMGNVGPSASMQGNMQNMQTSMQSNMQNAMHVNVPASMQGGMQGNIQGQMQGHMQNNIPVSMMQQHAHNMQQASIQQANMQGNGQMGNMHGKMQQPVMSVPNSMSGHPQQRQQLNNVGQMGSSGQHGQMGPTGQHSQMGPSGQHVQMGPTGQHGQMGPSGQQGHMGPTGQHGQMGPSGQHGQMGPSGQHGQMGPSGQHVQMGPTGQHVQMGPTGQHGQMGPSGQHGQMGPSGQHVQMGPTGQHVQMGPTGQHGQKRDGTWDAIPPPPPPPGRGNVYEQMMVSPSPQQSNPEMSTGSVPRTGRGRYPISAAFMGPSTPSFCDIRAVPPDSTMDTATYVKEQLQLANLISGYNPWSKS